MTKAEKTERERLSRKCFGGRKMSRAEVMRGIELERRAKKEANA